jgi:hypothetical protein
MTHNPAPSPAASSAAAPTGQAGRSLVDELTPDCLPELPPAHPDDFEAEVPPAPVS